MTHQNITLKIGGMECSGCVRSVENALIRIPGVLSVQVSLEEEKADVQAAEIVRLDQLIEAVEEAGFEAESAPITN